MPKRSNLIADGAVRPLSRSRDKFAHLSDNGATGRDATLAFALASFEIASRMEGGRPSDLLFRNCQKEETPGGANKTARIRTPSAVLLNYNWLMKWKVGFMLYLGPFYGPHVVARILQVI